MKIGTAIPKGLVISLCGLWLSSGYAQTQPGTTPTPSNTWIKILVDQDGPFIYGTDSAAAQAYANAVYQLAPGATQIHIRVSAQTPLSTSPLTFDASIINQYSVLLNTLMKTYLNNNPKTTLQLGYHPDNDNHKDMYQGWGCSDQDWQCVLNRSIAFMNAVNNQLKDTPQAQFKIFSIEQSYFETDPGLTSIQNIKACLSGNNEAGSCPKNVTVASPTTTYGIVSGNGGRGGDNQYGPDLYDFGYPQGYNLAQLYDASNPPPVPPEFPVSSLPNGALPTTGQYYVVDTDPSCTYWHKNNFPYLPMQMTQQCQKLGNNVTFSVYGDPNTTPITITPDLAGNYVAWLLSWKNLQPQTSTGGEITWMFSGEASPSFMGVTGWTLDQIHSFYQSVVQYLNTYHNNNPQNPSDASTIPFGIWNYDQILLNNFPPSKAETPQKHTRLLSKP